MMTRGSRLLLLVANALFFSSYSSVNSSSVLIAAGQSNKSSNQHRQQRILNTWMTDADGCHQPMLSNSLSSGDDNIQIVRGVVFALQNTGASTVDVSSLSVYLDDQAAGDVGFELYTMNGDGTTSLGTTLDGSGDWQKAFSGSIGDTELEDDGATFLGSFGANSIQLQSGEIKSFYLKFDEAAITVSHSVTNPDSWDQNAVSLNDYSMQITVGRSDIVWSTNADKDWYTPSIISCKLWTRDECPPNIAPTLSPSQSSQPTVPRVIQTATIVDNTMDLFFDVTIDDIDSCSSIDAYANIIYPMMDESFEEISMSAYQDNILSTEISFKSHEDVSSNGAECSVVRFYYDMEITYKIAEDDPTPAFEVMLSTVNTEEFSQELTTNIASKASGIPGFSTLSGVGPTVIRDQSLAQWFPTSKPSYSPSLRPSRSPRPSSSPTISPSSKPSYSPSLLPSSIPTTAINEIQVDFYFFISFPSSKASQVEQDLLGNMTLAFENRFTVPSNNELYEYHNDDGIQLEFVEDPIAQKIIGASNEDCVKGDAIATEFNECERFVVLMRFQHLRKKVTGPLVTHYIRLNSDEIARELSITYDGDASVKKDFLLIVKNVDGLPSSEAGLCDELRVQLHNEVYNFNITEVSCSSFDFTQYIRRNIRKLQEAGNLKLGELTVEYRVIGEYREIDGNDPSLFGGLIEDSINADSGEKIVKSLEERQLLSGVDMTAETVEVVAADPIPVAPFKQDMDIASSDSSLGSTGIAIIVVCVVVFFFAVFFFYKAIQRIKVINEDPFYDGEGIVKPDVVSAELYKDTSSDDDPEVKRLSDDPDNAEIIAMNTNQPSLNSVAPKSDENLDRQHSIARLNAFENRQQNAVAERSLPQDQNFVRSSSNSSVDSFEERLRRKAEDSSSNIKRSDSYSSTESFERRLRNKISGNGSNIDASLNSFEERLRRKIESNMKRSDSNSSLNSFEDRLRRKIESSMKRSDSNSSLNSFEERLRRKTESNMKRSDSNSSLNSFEERLRRKTVESSATLRHKDSNSSVDTFEERLRKKTESNSANNISFEERLRRKARKGNGDKGKDVANYASNQQDQSSPTSTFESRLRKKLSDGSSKSRTENDSFQDRLTRKMNEGSQSSRSHSTSPLSSSFDDRLRKKLSSDRSSSNFESRLQKKLTDESRSSSERENSFDKRLAQKLNGRSSSARSIASNNSVSSFEERLQNQLSSDGKSSEDKFQEVFEKAKSLKKSKENGPDDDDDSAGIV